MFKRQQREINRKNEKQTTQNIKINCINFTSIYHPFGYAIHYFFFIIYLTGIVL